MPKQRHDQHHAATTNTSVLPAADCRCSSQQAAAAWAWFEHGGSSCITPPKAQGLMAAKHPPHANCNSAGPSRFKQELLITPMKIPQVSADATTEDHPQRRHSFHSHDVPAQPTSFMYPNLSSSCRSRPNSPRFNIGVGAHLNEADHEEGGNISCQDHEASSLLDKFEVEALCRQLHDHLITPRTGLNSTCSAERQAHHEAQNARDDHLQAHHKPRCCKSSHAAHKPLADNEHHHININDVVHRLLHLRIKMSRRSTSSAAPTLMCSSIATANSIFDHHHHPAASPNQLRKVTSIDQMTKLQDTLHVRSNMQNTGRVSNYSGEFAAADEHESQGEFTSRRRKSQQKMRCRDHELVEGASPSRLHEADIIYSKALQQPLLSRLPHMSVLLGHKVHGDHPSRGDGVVRSKQNSQCHKHHHIHHHHHHYHDLQHIDYALQDGLLLQDHLITNKVIGADLLHRPKLYGLNHKEELMIPSHAGAV